MKQDIPRTLTEKINWLFENIRHPNGKEYTYMEVEERTSASGYRVSAPYIWNLRKGKSDNPSWLILRGLAQFFGISVTYFYDDHLNDDKLLRVKLEAAMQNDEVQEIAIRVTKMEESQRHSLLEFWRAFMEK